MFEVYVSKKAEKQLKKIPRHIVVQFDLWVQVIELDGHEAMQKMKGYRDHPLKGTLKGFRSSYLSKSYRVIYSLDEGKKPIVVEVIEVNKHVYKK